MGTPASNKASSVKPATRQFNFRIPLDLSEKLEFVSTVEDRTQTELCVAAIELLVAARQKDPEFRKLAAAVIARRQASLADFTDDGEADTG